MNLPGSEGFRPIAPDGNFPGMAPVNMNDIMRPPVNMGLDGLPMHLPPPHMLPPAFLAHLMATGRPPPLPLHPSGTILILLLMDNFHTFCMHL
jgi:hypothetical protein